MILLALDFETTGLDSEKDRIIEIGAVLFESGKENRIIQVLDIVVCPDIDFELPIEIPGLDKEFIKQHGISIKNAFHKLIPLYYGCDYVIAHNAQFDKGFFDKHVPVYFDPKKTDVDPKKWLCTMHDLSWSGGRSLKKCVQFCEHHDIKSVMNMPHRAISDAFSVMQILQYAKLDTMIENSKSEMVKIKARVNFDNKDRAKEAGFYWNPEKKQWNKKIRECFLPFEKNTNFEIEVIS